jgi:hypothetical protein
MTTREEAQDMTERALTIAALGSVLLADEQPEIQGAALAEMMAIFLRGHRLVDDPRSEHEMRNVVFEQWIKTVRDLVLIHDKSQTGLQ